MPSDEYLERKIAVAVFAPTFPPAFKGGGPSRSLDALTEAAPDRYDVFVLTSDRDYGDVDALPIPRNVWVSRRRLSVMYASVGQIRTYIRALRSVRRRQPEILYLNSFFNLKLSIIPNLLSRIGFWGAAIRLVAPRGEFGAGALSRRAKKKRMFIRVFRLAGLHHGLVWHATSEQEVVDIREEWGARARVVFRPNETKLPTMATAPGEDGGRLRLVSLGRLVEHKGLLVVLRGMNTVSAPMSFDIFGSEEDRQYAAKCRAAAALLPSHIDVRFRGPLAPDRVTATLAQYDALVLPTAGENFGHVIAEALSVSCAVVTTPWTPWTDVLKGGGGIVVDDRSVEAWGSTLQSLGGLSGEMRLTIRRRAGAAFTTWAGRAKEPHVFDLAGA